MERSHTVKLTLSSRKGGTGRPDTVGRLNTYTGSTTVSTGALIVNGSIASSSLTTVNSGAALSGSGTVGSTVINTGGFLVPGPVGTPGNMKVTGNLAFQSGAFYVVQVNPTTASSTNVSGTASLAGTVGAIFAPGTYLVRSYPILTTGGGLTGTFDALATSGLRANFQTSLSYTATTAFLNLRAQLVPEPTPPTPTPPTPTPPTPTQRRRRRSRLYRALPPIPGLPLPSRRRCRSSPSTSLTSAMPSTTSSTMEARCRRPSCRSLTSPATISPHRWTSFPAKPRPARRKSPSSSPTSSST